MMSTDGVELTNLINPELTWKTVAKGSRSATRRTRKSVARSAMAEAEVAEKSAREVEAEGVSESKKLGVAAVGRHFAGKVEHVPIKKRKFMVQPSSPPPSKKSSSLHHKVPEQFVQINHVSKLSASVVDGKSLEVSSEKLSCNGHDFSGIEILADVACNSCMGDYDIVSARDNPLVEESVQQPNSSTLAVPVEGINSSSRATVTSQKDTVHEGDAETIAPQDYLVAVSEKSSADKCNTEAGQGESQNNSIAVADNPSADEHNQMASKAETEKLALLNNSIVVSANSSADEPIKKPADGETENIASQHDSVAASDKSSTDEYSGKVENTAFSRDGRLHWDLNLSADAWEQPRDVGDDASQKNFIEDSKPVAHSQRECSDNNNDHVDGVIASDGHGNISMPSPLNAHTDLQNSKELQCGYDSQFEDGELRESYPCWEENDGDAGEIEHVDYDTEPEDERFYSLAESNEKKMENLDKGVVSESCNGSRKSDSCPFEDASCMRMTETNDGSDVEKHIVVCMNDSHEKGSASKEFMSKPFKRELPSRDAIHRRRSNVYDDSYDKDTGSDKFMGRDGSSSRPCGRSPWRGHFSYWDSSKRRHSPIYNNGSHNFGRPGPKGLVEGRGCMNGSDHSVSGTEGHIRRQFSNGAYRSRFRRYPEGPNRDFRGIDRSLPNDSNEYSGRLQHRMANRRERSNSPVFRRLHYHQTYRKSTSRSRSRSPISWNNRNRLPNFKMDNRMSRVRLPFQKCFPADHQKMGFMAPPRNRCSPLRNSRLFEDRSNSCGDNNNNINNNFKGRKSPVRMFRPGQRFDSGQSLRRVNSENHFRPMMRHRRFPDGASAGGGGGGRGCKYEGNEEKNRNRYEMINRVKRYENTNGDNISRFRFNGEESFVANET